MVPIPNLLQRAEIGNYTQQDEPNENGTKEWRAQMGKSIQFFIATFQLRCHAQLFNSRKMKIPIPFLGPEKNARSGSMGATW